jgi:hypothetical protein
MKTDKISIYKLTSNEEIMGEVAHVSGEVIQLNNPLKIDKIQSMDGNIYFTLRSWYSQQYSDYKDKTIPIFTQHIMSKMKPTNDSIQHYIKTLDYLKTPKEDDIHNVLDEMSDSDNSNVIFHDFDGKFH